MGPDFVIREVVPDGWIQTYPINRLLVHNIHRSLFDVSRDTGSPALQRITGRDVVGMSVSPDSGLLYALTLQKPDIIVIDPSTAQTTYVSTLDIDIQEGDIDFDPTTGVLYGMWGGNNMLFTIDISTGQTHAVGPINMLKDPSAMAFDDAGNLFVVDGNTGLLLQLDKTTATVVATIPLSENGLGQFAGMDFESQTGQLFLVTSGDADSQPRLFTVDILTGQLTTKGLTAIDLSAMEFIADPAHVIRPGSDQFGARADFGNFKPIYLLDGSDAVHAAGDDDKIYGDNLVTDPNVISIGDADLIFGGDGGDKMFGQDKDDVLWGADPTLGFSGTDDDHIDGGVGDDTVRQTINNDQTLTNVLLTGQGSDSLVSIEKAILTGGASGNRIDASAFTAGPVTLIGLDGSDELLGGTGDDVLQGGDGDDPLLSGGDGNDTLVGGAGSDVLKGDDGDDIYRFHTAVPVENDQVIESAGAAGGIDTLDFSTLGSTDGVQVDLTAAVIATHTNRQVNTPDPSLFENAFGGLGQDELIGNAAANWLAGGDNADTLVGLGDDDLLGGGNGDDYLDGGNDNDVYQFLSAPVPETDTINEAVGPVGGVDTVSFFWLPPTNRSWSIWPRSSSRSTPIVT